jgi:PAS domain S-box-containing protein
MAFDASLQNSPSGELSFEEPSGSTPSVLHEKAAPNRLPESLLGTASDFAQIEQPRKVHKGVLRWGLALLLATAALAAGLPSLIIAEKRDQLVGELDARLEVLAYSRAQLVSAWLDGRIHPVDRFSEGELLRLFASEVARKEGAITDPPKSQSKKSGSRDILLESQIPFMAQVLADFAAGEDYRSAHLFGGAGDHLVGSEEEIVQLPLMRRLATESLTDSAPRFGPVHLAGGDLVIDLAWPVFPERELEENASPTLAMVVTFSVGNLIQDAISPPALAQKGETLALVQRAGTDFHLMQPLATTPLKNITLPQAMEGLSGMTFGERKSLLNGAPVYSLAAAVIGPQWWIFQEKDGSVVDAEMAPFVKAVWSFAGLSFVLVVIGFVAFWWGLSSRHTATAAEQFRRLASRIESQRRLFESLTNTIDDFIGLKGPGGRYRFVNRAFAEAAGLATEELVKMDDNEIFGPAVGERLAFVDRVVFDSGQTEIRTEDCELQGRKLRLQFSKVPFVGDDGRITGVVTVARDVSRDLARQVKREQAITEAVSALVQAIEARDSYLAGHSQRVARLSGAIATEMNLTNEDAATLDIAAHLSQIGKIAIPRGILTKAERLTPEEEVIMRGHIGHAETILCNLEFGLPVLEAVLQMHERLDGNGYPNGLKGDEISMHARVLGVCDVFCARISPRAYRDPIAPDQALTVLKENAARYDQKVVAALDALKTKGALEEILAA